MTGPYAGYTAGKSPVYYRANTVMGNHSHLHLLNEQEVHFEIT